MALDDVAAINAEELPETIAAPAVWTRVPDIIRRNSRLLLGAEAFVGTGQQMVPTLGAIMILSLTGSAALAGLGGSALGLTRVLASYPSGLLADTYGRKAILVAGLLLSLVGAVGLGFSMVFHSFPLFLIALTIFGIGNGASQQQRRLATADMYPPALRARGLGFVLTGSVIGALGGPVLIGAAGLLAAARGFDQVSMSWFLVPLVLAPSLVLILLIRPDPREISLHLERFYPGYQPAAGAAASPTAVSLWTFLRTYPHLVAFVCMFVLYANMSMMMALAPMTMTADGMTLSAISITVAIHVLGMYAISMPIGNLADTLGRRGVMFLAVFLSTIGTVLVALTAVAPLIVSGLFLIGLGWSCGNVATAALVADTTPAGIRGSAMGANSSFSAAGSVSAPLLGGLLLARLGGGSLVSLTLVIMVPTVLLLARLRETKPGEYAHATPW